MLDGRRAVQDAVCDDDDVCGRCHELATPVTVLHDESGLLRCTQFYGVSGPQMSSIAHSRGAHRRGHSRNIISLWTCISFKMNYIRQLILCHGLEFDFLL